MPGVNWVLNIADASDALAAVVAEWNYRNLDEVPAFEVRCVALGNRLTIGEYKRSVASCVFGPCEDSDVSPSATASWLWPYSRIWLMSLSSGREHHHRVPLPRHPHSSGLPSAILLWYSQGKPQC